MSEPTFAAMIVLAGFGLALAMALSAGDAALQRLVLAAGEEVDQLAAHRRRRAERLMRRAGTVVPAAALTRVIGEVLFGVGTTLAVREVWDGWPALLGGIAAALVAGLAVALIRPGARGRLHPGRVLRWTGWLLSACDLVFRPLRGLLTRFAPPGLDRFTAEQLADLVENLHTTEDIEATDREMLSSVVELGQTLVRELMVPRTEVVSIGEDKPLRKAMSLFLRSGHSRVPVVGPEGLDDVRGVAYLKDVALVLQAHGDTDRPVSSLMRPAVFTPESKPADDLLRHLQALGTHVALVVDEYGGVAGLVTMEDILEEIVGELRDEHDPDPLEAEALPDGSYRVPARMELDQLGDLLGMEIDDDDAQTVGGLLAKAAGRVPIGGTRAVVDGLELAADRQEGRRKQVSTVLVRQIPVQGGNDDGN